MLETETPVGEEEEEEVEPENTIRELSLSHPTITCISL